MNMIQKRVLSDQQEMINYLQANTAQERPICTHFGCGEALKPWETLFGDKCSAHSIPVKVDIMKVINGKR